MKYLFRRHNQQTHTLANCFAVYIVSICFLTIASSGTYAAVKNKKKDIQSHSPEATGLLNTEDQQQLDKGNASIPTGEQDDEAAAEPIIETKPQKQPESNPLTIEIEGPADSSKDILKNDSGSFYQDFKKQQEQTLIKTQKVADQSQKNVSVRLHQFSGYVDKFFAEENYVQESYDSRLRLSLANQYQEYSTPRLKPRINLSLSLPNTKNRWRLRFQSNESEETDESSDNNFSNNEETDSTFTTALGLTIKTSKKTDVRANVGIKFNTPIDPFTRLRFRRSIWLENIEMRLTETFEWRDTRGKTAQTQFEIEYPLSDNYFFRSKTESTYWDIDSYWSGSQSFTLYDQLTSKSVIAYAVGVHVQNEDEFHLRKKDQVNDYWVETRYRKKFYKDWLFYQVSPGLVRPREYEFETLPRLELKIEAVYGQLTEK